jgi:hypothetical protein
MKLEFSLLIVEEKLKIIFHENPSNGNPVTPRGLADRYDEAVAFRNVAKASRN